MRSRKWSGIVLSVAVLGAVSLATMPRAEAGPLCEENLAVAIEAATIAGLLVQDDEPDESRLATARDQVESLQVAIEQIHAELYSVKNQRLWKHADRARREVASVATALDAGDIATAAAALETLAETMSGYVESECEAP